MMVPRLPASKVSSCKENEMNFRISLKPLRRRASRAALSVMFMTSVLAFAGLTAAPARADISKAQEIADHFAAIKTMTGDFVQFGPRGDQSGGKFYIERPGKVRFNYDPPSPIRVISDGKALVVGNTKLATWSMYPFSQTPLALLLGNKIDLASKMVRDVKEEADLVTIVMGDKTVFGDSTITMMFDPKSDDLRQWTITDPQGKETSVMI
jgi:outer membrane lipoprotein-sorting protein